jgi:hypothetical protein
MNERRGFAAKKHKSRKKDKSESHFLTSVLIESLVSKE